VAQSSHFSPPERLKPTLDTAGFDSGVFALDEWLKRFALTAQQAETCRSFVVCEENRGVGFYSLAVGAVDHVAVPARVAKGVGRHPLPVMLLARLAVDRRYGGRGLGKGLLKDAIQRSTLAADMAGIRAILVHAKDEKARAFYERFGFESSPLDPLQMLLLMKDARRAFDDKGKPT
jgi:GNAT superfamily N-acetyltransferase